MGILDRISTVENHVFRATHSWVKVEMPDALKEVCVKTLGFFK